MFIDEITTRVTVKADTSELDNAISKVSGGLLGDIMAEQLNETKDKIVELEEPLADGIAQRLAENQSNIIDSKHHVSGDMANSVDVMEDGKDRLVGDTASSVDGFPYPLAIEKGSRDHWVAPVTFDALHWTDKNGEYWSRGHMVSGIKADPFVEPSIRNTIWDIDEILEDTKEWQEL